MPLRGSPDASSRSFEIEPNAKTGQRIVLLVGFAVIGMGAISFVVGAKGGPVVGRLLFLGFTGLWCVLAYDGVKAARWVLSIWLGVVALVGFSILLRPPIDPTTGAPVDLETAPRVLMLASATVYSVSGLTLFVSANVRAHFAQKR